MTTALAALAITCSCAQTPIVTSPSAPPLAGIVTWNTHAGRGDLGRLATDVQRDARCGDRTPAPCVLLLQEVAASDLEAVTARGWAVIFMAVRGDGNAARGNAIVASVPLRDPRVIPLPRERQTRAAAVASIELAGHALFVASVHLENRATWWRGGGLLGDTARGHQVESLLRALPQGARGMLGGDLNTWLGPSEAAWQRLAQRFADTPDWLPTPTFHDRLVLDHLLMDLPEGWHVMRQVMPDRYGSDHHPVLGMVFAN